MVKQQDNNIQVECKNVWKIFGKQSDIALKAIKEEGLGKPEVFAKYGCVVGVVNASFSVARGELFCIMGLSGSGKSTLVRTINGLISTTDGQVVVNNQITQYLSSEEVRKMRAETIGMVFQHMSLWPHRNILDNVSFGLEIRGISKAERYKRARIALEKVELGGWEKRYPDELSGGMQQRVGLARAITADPEILLMDEPFSALDPLIRRQLQDEFLHLAREEKKTTLFITHDLDEAIRIGDRIAIMNDGVIVQIGTPEEIITNPKDDYVKEFVKGISRLKLVYARTVMTSLEKFSKESDSSLDDAIEVSADVTLEDLDDEFIGGNRFVVVVEDGVKTGVVTIESLLKGIKGSEDD